ncbi:hypothetical protein GKD00_03000 [Lactobacillus ruminis]|uniref:ABC transporter permease n=1 Tax=Ligilactobacillus ruminis TaxID=1623 RepID=UPI00101FFAE6|nr:ABC transporter permease [Ligilactobacillus ruminis]MSB43726.1 hypothetical protein [Ligilactobacillus ruminis]MSB53946.1 hypothetical protein [Ligilactobacillus ruminis]MSB55913.1 hypothetical protein [Ligilactobacillus ruminis]MSB80961.1 hypothetical protein [Ligilactobacillus ruminis]MSB91451.1 hypothetical protein [Ligilactobacillus ruminis]
MTSEAEISLLKKKRRKLEKRIDEQESFIRNFTQLLEEGEDNLARVQPYLALDEYDRKNYTFTGCGDFGGLHFNWQDVFQKMIDDGSMPDYQGMHDEDFTFRLYIDGYTRFSVRMPYFYSHEEFLRDFRSFEHAFEEYDLKRHLPELRRKEEKERRKAQNKALQEELEARKREENKSFRERLAEFMATPISSEATERFGDFLIMAGLSPLIWFAAGYEGGCLTLFTAAFVFITAFIFMAFVFNCSIETLLTVLFIFFVTLLIIGCLIKFFSVFIADPPKKPEKPASPAPPTPEEEYRSHTDTLSGNSSHPVISDETVLSYYDYYIEGIASRLPGRIAEIKAALAGYRSRRDELQARLDKVTEQLRELGEDWDDNE